MKHSRYLFLLAAASLLASCGNGGTPTASDASSPASVDSTSVESGDSAWSDPCSIESTSISGPLSKYTEGPLSTEEIALFARFGGTAYSSRVLGFKDAHVAEYSAKYNTVSFTIPNSTVAYAASYVTALAGNGYVVAEEPLEAGMTSAYSALYEYGTTSNMGTVIALIYTMGQSTYVDFMPHTRSIADMTEWEPECKEIFAEGFYEGADEMYPTYQKDSMTCYTGYLETYGVLRFVDTEVTLRDVATLLSNIEGLGYTLKTDGEGDDEWTYYSLVDAHGEHGIQLNLTTTLTLYYDCYFWAE